MVKFPLLWTPTCLGHPQSMVQAHSIHMDNTQSTWTSIDMDTHLKWTVNCNGQLTDMNKQLKWMSPNWPGRHQIDMETTQSTRKPMTWTPTWNGQPPTQCGNPNMANTWHGRPLDMKLNSQGHQLGRDTQLPWTHKLSFDTQLTWTPNWLGHPFRIDTHLDTLSVRTHCLWIPSWLLHPLDMDTHLMWTHINIQPFCAHYDREWLYVLFMVLSQDTVNDSGNWLHLLETSLIGQ